MKNRSLLFLLSVVSCALFAQNNTFSPYSRYGMGELAPQTFAHNQGMGGAFIALKPDSTMPVLVNTGNPAAYPLVRFTALEVGGRYLYSDFRSGTSGLRRWGTNFSYGSLGFPVGARGGAAIGVMPYSSVGYSSLKTETSAIGDMRYQYDGSGGTSKAFIGYGIMPFSRRHLRYRLRHLNVPDSVEHRTGASYRRGEVASKLMSDLSLGVNANYLFGNVQHTARVIYPSNQLYNNTYSERSYFVGGFTGNFGVQTGFTIDSVRSAGRRRALNEKVKIVAGFYMSLGNTLNAATNAATYNFIYNSSGNESVRDTVAYEVDVPSQLVLPMEQGFGISLKKAEKLIVAADFGVKNWAGFRAPHNPGFLTNSYRAAFGVNYVPEKLAAGRGAFWRKSNYRFGGSYETGSVRLSNTPISTWFVSAGIGLPVGIGRLSSMVHISAQAGQTGTLSGGLVKENFVRLHFGFTFCDRWFQKFRYD